MPGTYSNPYPNSPATGDAPVSLVVRANFQALQSQINNADGAALNAGSVPETALASAINPRLARTEAGVGYVASGLAAGFSTLTASIGTGVAYVNGYRINSLGAVSTLLASKDYYADIDASGNITFNGVSNNATAPTLATGSLRLAKFVVGPSAIVQVLQGAFNTAPVSPNTTNWFGFDSLGNAVYNTNPVAIGIIGLYEGSTNYSSAATSATLVTGYSFNAIIPAYRRAIVSLALPQVYNTSIATNVFVIYDGGSPILQGNNQISTANAGTPVYIEIPVYNNSATSVTKTYNLYAYCTGGTLNIPANTTNLIPTFKAELR